MTSTKTNHDFGAEMEPSLQELRRIVDDLGTKITTLQGVIENVDSRVRGNGKPGLIQQVALTKQRLDSLQLGIDRLESSFKIQVTDLKTLLDKETDTGRFEAIAREVASAIAEAKIMATFERFELKATQDKEKEDNQPGSWLSFKKNANGIVIAVVTSILISLTNYIIMARLINGVP